MSKISIITINYNDAKGLEKSILSILNQSLIDFEFIVIDGDSNDGSKIIIEKYKDKFTHSVSEKDNGIYHAMNKGIKVAKGDYLLFMNSGDALVDNNSILTICEEKLKEDIVAFDCFLEKDSKIVSRRTHVEKPTLFYVYKNGFKHQSTFIKRSLFEKLGFYNENYKIAGDYEFWIRCFLDSATTSRSYPIPIAIFQLGGISQNSDWNKEHRQIEKEWLPIGIKYFYVIEKFPLHVNLLILKVIIKIQTTFKNIFT